MTNYRLAGNVVPVDYDIKISPDIPAKTFIAHVIITFKQNAASEQAELFADKSLKIMSIMQNNERLEFTHVDDRLTIKGQKLAESPVRIDYTGSLDHPAVGLYYVNNECVSSQFEAISARLMFPCFDEPTVKSTFKITVTTLKKFTVLSNMPVSTTVINGGLMTTSFFRTPPMCTYLLALVIGNFDRLSGFTKRGLPVDVYADLGKSDFLKYPLEEAIKAIEWYEEFTQVNFPLPRLQLITIPNFPYGAMENFGLLIHRDTALLAKKGVTSESGLKRAAKVISHEIAHQWFGDGISPKWWNSVWLNEGFATIFPFLQFCETHPEWDNWGDFELLNVNSAYLEDASDHTHPIDTEVNSDAEVSAIFDGICYGKAACVIRMLLHYVGIDKLRDVLRKYLAKYMYGSVCTDDLCSIFSDVLGKDMKPFFDQWTLQSGYPLVILEEDLTIRQTRFTESGIINDRTWLIPLDIIYSKDGKVETMKMELNSEVSKFPVDGCDWIKLNHNDHSFCRVWHKGKWGNALVTALHELDSLDRFQLLRDTVALYKAGLLTSGDVIKTLNGYENETSYLVVSNMISIFKHLYSVFASERIILAEFGRKLLGSILVTVGKEKKEDESNDFVRIRATVFKALLELEDPETTGYLLSLFEQFKTTRLIDPDLITPVLSAGAGIGEIEFIKDVIDAEMNPEIKQAAVRSLGCVRYNKLQSLMFEVFSSGNVQNVSPFLFGIADKQENTDLLWQFIKDNIEMLISKYGTTMFLLPNAVEIALSYCTREEEAQDVEQFAAAHPGTILDRSYSKAAASIRVRAALIIKESSILRETLTS